MRVLLTSIALAALFVGSPAAAQANDGSYSVSIPYKDLNLASAAGQATFHARVKSEVNRVCSTDFVSPLRETNEIRQCRAQLTHAAQQSLELALRSVDGTRLASR